MSINVYKWLFESNRYERIILLAGIDFKLMYYGNKLGLLWALINPISQIAVYYLVFEVLMNGGIENFPIYVFSGLFVWMFFTQVTGRSVSILRSKKQFYEHTDMNKIEIYLAQILGSSIGFLFNFIIFLITALFYNIYPSFEYLYFIFIYINLFILSLGVSLILSNLFLLFEDINQIWSIAVRFGFFLSPILFRGNLFQEKLPILNYLNPFSGIINNTRAILLDHSSPDWGMMLFDYGYALLILLLGVTLLNRFSLRASELI